jgi:hypothetical protein
LLLASSLIDGVGALADDAQAAPSRQAVARHQLHRGGLMQENRRLQQQVDSAYAAAASEFADEILGSNAQDNPTLFGSV